MVSSGLHILNTHDTFERSRLEQVAGVSGVQRVSAVYIEDRLSALRNPVGGATNTIRVFGIDVSDPMFDDEARARSVQRLREPMSVLFDRRSRSFFGALSEGVTTELAERQVVVAGTFDLGADYYYDGNVLASAETFFTL